MGPDGPIEEPGVCVRCRGDRCYRGDGLAGKRGRKEDKNSQESNRVISDTTIDRHVQLKSDFR